LKRTKRRYLALHLDVESALGEREFMEAVWSAVTKLYGEFGASLTSLALISFDCERKFAVIRSNLIAVDNVKTALATIIALGGKEAAVHVLGVSGTIKALHKNLSC
jgi:ribonuclease P/MRP protein subunit POP5